MASTITDEARQLATTKKTAKRNGKQEPDGKAKGKRNLQMVLPVMRVCRIPIRGTSSLIVHKWSEKAKQEMRDKQFQNAAKPKTAKNPEECYLGSLYTNGKTGEGVRFGFPAIAFKKAMVRAGKLCDVAMTDAKQMFHVLADFEDLSGDGMGSCPPLVEIDGEPKIREDMVKLNGKTADLRYRGEYREWAAVLSIRYDSSLVSIEQLVGLCMRAGIGVGVGEWRPEKDGDHGCWSVCDGDIEDVG